MRETGEFVDEEIDSDLDDSDSDFDEELRRVLQEQERIKEWEKKQEENKYGLIGSGDFDVENLKYLGK